MEGWQVFDDSRFELTFKHPSHTPDREAVERVETIQTGRLRVHVLALQSREVYFEVTKYDSLSAEAEYRRHGEALPLQFDGLVITELQESTCASLPAYEYTFEWDQGKRVVILVERGEATYRLLYNPRFPVNLQILSTLEWLNLP